MLIHEVAAQTGLPTKTIRYYELVRLLPPAQRGTNNYRYYTAADGDRLRLIAGARSIGFSLTDIASILAARDAGEAPCGHVLTTLEQHLAALERRLNDLLALRTTLAELRRLGASLPQDDVLGTKCICAVLKAYSGRQAPSDAELERDDG
ncbi:MAG: Cd(II)/Pb(II)-responsive transcriptional regulator [Herpetosiphon sp.]